MCLLVAACGAAPVAAAAGPTLTASPSSVATGGSVTVSWGGVASPTGTDWIGLYRQGASDSAIVYWFFTSTCTASAGAAKASGSCAVAMPRTAGTYEFRLFANNGYTRLATSGPVTIGSSTSSDTTPPSVALTTPADGSTVSGSVQLAATASDDVGVVKVEFLVNGSLVATDTSAPYTATWDSATALNGKAQLAARAWDAAGNTTSFTVKVSVQNDPILLAAGDQHAGCSSDTDDQTAAIVARYPGAAVAALGDLAGDSSTAADWPCYDASWGAFKARTRPAIGNHEYDYGPAPYFSYWGAAAGDPSKGYYSYDLGAWHVVVLNANCSEVSCAAGSPQEQWLRQDLAAHSRACTLAYWHQPLFASSTLISTAVRPPVRALRAPAARRHPRRGQRDPRVRRRHRRRPALHVRAGRCEQRGARDDDARRARAGAAPGLVRLAVPPRGRGEVHRLGLGSLPRA
jgi:hypothetical protein